MDQLASLTRKLLPSMFDAGSGLFAQKAIWTPYGPRALRTNALYSAISAVGIYKDVAGGGEVPVRLDVTIDTLFDTCLRSGASTGLIASTTWALATAQD